MWDVTHRTYPSDNDSGGDSNGDSGEVWQDLHPSIRELRGQLGETTTSTLEKLQIAQATLSSMSTKLRDVQAETAMAEGKFKGARELCRNAMDKVLSGEAKYEQSFDLAVNAAREVYREAKGRRWQLEGAVDDIQEMIQDFESDNFQYMCASMYRVARIKLESTNGVFTEEDINKAAGVAFLVYHAMREEKGYALAEDELLKCVQAVMDAHAEAARETKSEEMKMETEQPTTSSSPSLKRVRCEHCDDNGDEHRSKKQRTE
jgi:hypothetical protein